MMHIHLATSLILWLSLGGLALVICGIVIAGIRRLLIRHRLMLLAQDIAAVHPDTIHTVRPCCEGCFTRRRAVTHYLYDEPTRQAFLCASCERRVKLHIRQLPSTTQRESFYDDTQRYRHSVHSHRGRSTFVH